MTANKYCVFDYLYRDAGNYKAWGELLLQGVLLDADVECFRERFVGGGYFIAEQIGIPTLFEKLWEECHSCRSDLDHVWHEFSDVREATPEDVASLPLWGKVDDLVTAVRKISKWNEACSTNWGGMWS